MDLLEKLSLTKNETELYLWFIRNGDATAAEAARNTNTDKSSAYRATENLFQLGLLTKNEKARGTVYSAQNPENLKDLLKFKQNELTSLESSLDDFISNLKQQALHSRDTLIKVEKGYDAHIRLMELSVNDNPTKIIREFWTLNNPLFKLSYYSRYLEGFIKRRLELKIHDQYLARFSPEKKWSKQMNPSSKSLKEIRLMPEEFQNNNGFRLFGDYAEIISFPDDTTSEAEFLIITIKDKIIVKLLNDIFSYIWNRSKLYTVDDYKRGELEFNKSLQQ